MLVDRKFGCFFPTPTISGGAYVYNFDYLESTVGRKFDVYSTFIDLSSDYPGNPNAPSTRKMHSDIAAAAAAGHDILIALGTTVGYVQASDGNYYPSYATGADIRTGAWNARLTNLFTWLLGLGVTITVRWCWESNLGPNVSVYYPGCGAKPSTGTPSPPTNSPLTPLTTTGLSVYTNPADYIATWQYVTNLLRSLPNSNHLKMFYCPGSNDGSAAQASGNTLTDQFPGTAYVDYVGYDTYNEIGSTWHTPLDTLRGPRESDVSKPFAYDILTTLHPTADVWIGEINCMDQNDAKDTSHAAVGHSKAQWYTDLFAIADELPRLKVINFFDQPGTRNTWPFNSSSAAMSAFVTGFNYGSDSNQHGVVAAAYSPTGGVPPANPTGVNLPFPANHMPGDSGRTNWLNAHEYYINQVAKPDNSGWVSLASNSDGTIPNLSVVRQAGGTYYVPNISIHNPGSANYDLLSTKLGTNTHVSFAVRDDGRLAWGPGDTGDADVFQQRVAGGVVQISGPGTTTGNLSVTGFVQSNNLALPNAISTPTAPASGGGVQVYSQADALKVRNVGMAYTLGPPQTAKFTALCAFAPEEANSTSSALTSGVIYLIRIIVPDSRVLSRVGFNIIAGGTGLISGQCFAGIYDAAGNLLGQTSDQSAVWNTSGSKNMNLSSVGSLLVNPSYVYAAFLSNGTTGPTISRSNGLGNWLQVGGANTNYAKYSSGLTSLPTSITMTSLTIDSDNKFCSIS